MFNPYEIFIGLRYVRAKRRNHFISFISLSSILGVTLGVTAVITVMAVMNGFEKEMTDRILGMVSHATVVDQGGELIEWQPISAEVESHPEILGAAPYFRAEGMLTYNKRVQGTIIRAVIPKEEIKVSEVANKMVMGDFTDLKAGDYGIVIGREMARTLGVLTGDKITLIVPQANVTPAGILPRLKRFTVVGIFEIGMNEYDSSLALIHLEDAKRLFKVNGPSGLRIKTTDVMQAPNISREVMTQIPGRYGITDWTQEHRNFFRALKTEKIVMFIILALIVAVAAFNIISTLVMMVVDKQADIAVLRTMGASPRSIMKIFMIQGTLIGLFGMILGDIFGIWLANQIDVIVKKIEQIFDVDVLPCDVYYVCDFPSDMHWNDVIYISVVTFLLCLFATIYPAMRAARTQPAEALRYE